MDTQEVLNNFDNVLVASGISEEERAARGQVLQDCIIFGEMKSLEIKELKKKLAAKQRKVTLVKALELSFIALVVGWFAGILTLHYMQAQQ